MILVGPAFDGGLLDPRAFGRGVAARNAAPIAELLKRVLLPSGPVLEIASGSGEHAAHFARALPALVWQPGDPDETARRSTVAHARAAGLANIRSPLSIDATRQPWPVTKVGAVVAINTYRGR